MIAATSSFSIRATSQLNFNSTKQGKTTGSMVRVLVLASWLGVATVMAAECKSTGEFDVLHPECAKPAHILHFSDVHLNLSATLDANESANIPIEYSDDAPFSLLASALRYAKKVLPDPDFFLYTGDHAVHGDLEDDYLATVVETNVETMERFYPPNETDSLVTTALIGNADTSPDYTMEITDGLTANPEIALLSGAWKDSLSESDLMLLESRGFLAYELNSRLEVLTLNTVPYSPKHLPNTTDRTDPFDQFAWLRLKLAILKTQKKFAYIVGHIPPIIDSYSGAVQWHESYIATYKEIVIEFASVIKAQLFGHVHSIEVRIPLYEERKASNLSLPPLFLTAAISPIYKNNPAFVVWDFNPITFNLLDYTVYGTNISSNGEVTGWKSLFKATEAYGVKDLSSYELTLFAQRAADDKALLQRYYYNSKALSYKQSSCLDDECHAKWVCTLYWWSTAAEYTDCVTNGYHPDTVSVVSFAGTASGATSTWSSSTSLVVGITAGAAAVAVMLMFFVARRLNKRKAQAHQAATISTPSLSSAQFATLV